MKGQEMTATPTPTPTPTTSNNIEIPTSSIWYVKTGLDRALRMTKQKIEEIEKRIASLETKYTNLLKFDPNNENLEFISEFIKEAEEIKSYYAQWLREATDAYKTLPKEIRPTLDND